MHINGCQTLEGFSKLIYLLTYILESKGLRTTGLNEVVYNFCVRISHKMAL